MDISTILLITYTIIGVITVMTIYALVSDQPRVALNAPSILTSLGIFGTFLGITVGLSAFDPDDVSGSIPFLFSGIKLAFWTSVAGILGGILVKFRHLLLPLADSGASGARATIEDLVAAMRGVEDSLRDGDREPLVASLRGLQEEANAKADEMRSAVESMAGSMDAVRERDDAMLRQLEGIGTDTESLLQTARDSASAGAGGMADLGERIAQGQAELAGALGKAGDSLRQAVDKDLKQLAGKLSESGETSARQMRSVAEAIETLQGAMGSDAASMLERLEAIGQGSEALGERLSKTLGQGNAALAEALQGNRDALAAQIASAVTDLRDALVGPEGAASSLASDLQKGQVELAGALARATDSLRTAVGEDVDRLSERLAQGSEASAGQMHQVAEAIEALQTALGSDAAATLERLDKLNTGSAELGDRLRDILTEGNAALATSLEGNRDALGAQIATAVTDLRDALVGPDGAATRLGESLQGGQAELATALARAADGLRGAIGEDVAKIDARLAEAGETSAQRMREVAEAIETLQGAIGGDAAAMIEGLENLQGGSDALGKKLEAALGKSQQAMAEALEGGRDALAAQIAGAVTELRDALVGPDGAATALGEAMQKGQLDLASALARNADSLREAQGADLAGLAERMDGLGDGLHNLADSVSGAFGDAAGGLSGDVNNLATTVADAIDDLRLAIVGPEGTQAAIAEEIRAANEETGKSLSAIRKSLDENTQRQVDYSPKGLMQVLEELIKQFNTQFSGQFWEKVGGFNQAIAELTDWMETYRTQLNDMVGQQTKTARNMDTATRRFDEVASKSEIFIDVSKNISSLLGGIDSQRVQMESHLKRFAHIVDETSSNLENIEQRIIDGNSQMNEHLKEIAERIEEQVIRVDNAMDDELKKALITFGEQLAALSEKFVDDYTPLTDRLREVVSMARAV